MTRREIRNCAFILIYEKLLRDDPIEELYETADEIEEITVNDSVKILVESVLEKAELQYHKKLNKNPQNKSCNFKNSIL